MRRASLLLLVALCAGCSVVPTGKKWWSPGTWFSASELSSKQAAEAKETKAGVKVEQKTVEIFHAAHLEFFKAGLSLEGSVDLELTRRFNRNGLGLMAQVDPLTSAETAELYALVSDLRSGDAKRVMAAEEKQRKAEGENNRLSLELKDLQAKLAEAKAKADAANRRLDAAFLRENELADTLRNQRFIMWAAIGGFVFFAGLSLYLRIGLGSVGAGLHFLPKLVGKEKADQVIELLDQKADWLHQKLIGSGRKKEKAKEALSE